MKLFTLTCASVLLLVLVPHAVGAEGPGAGTVLAPPAVDVSHSIAGYANPFESASCLGAETASVGPQPEFLRSAGARWGWSLPSCFDLEGTYCPTPGQPLVRCMWQPGEPGACGCQSNNTYLCG